MGATLPAIARGIDGSAAGLSRLGLFYAGNIAGAVFGALLAGFYLLRVYDMWIATLVAVAINVVVAFAAWRLAGSPHPDLAGRREHAAAGERATSPERREQPAPRGSRGALIVIACSGFCALASEVIWTRLLSLIFSATVYTFSIILAVFLIGLGLGSSAGARLARRTTNPAIALACAQLLAAGGMAWTAVMLSASLPFWPINTSLAPSIWFNFELDFVRAAWATLPAPICWGASFPLALAAAAQREDDAAPVVGRVYAANTLGGIAGSLTASLLLVAVFGSQRAEQILIAISAGAAAIALLAAPRARVDLAWSTNRRRATALGLAGAVAVAALLIAAVPRLPPVLVAYGRHAAAWAGHTGEIVYLGEGLHASIAVSRQGGVLSYHNAGKVQASSQPADMRLQRMLGHLTTLVPEHPRSVLVIGCGAGVTAGAVSVNPQVEKVTIVDIEPLVPLAARKYFGDVNHHVLDSPKVHVVVDDARHFLMTTKEKFDAITSDPLDPWVKGAATLYTKEFFDTARAHLNPGGVMTLFVQLYESSPEAVKSEVATFFETFGDGMIFGNTFEGRAIDTVLVGPERPTEIWIDYIEELLRMPAYQQVARSLGEINLYTGTELFANYAGRARDLKPWTADALINRDRNLRLQYLAGFGVNQHVGDAIYADILQYRAFPDDLFIASESTLWRLKQEMTGTRE
jgi:spermidine synthase